MVVNPFNENWCQEKNPQNLTLLHKSGLYMTHLNLGGILSDQAYNMYFQRKLESIQYNACLTTTGAIMGTSEEKLYRELGLESLQL